MASKTASFPVIGLGLDPSGITKGLTAARNILKSGMDSLWSGISTPAFGVALANQAAEFAGKLSRLFGEPFRQLMEQEDLTSKFSLAAGGAVNAKKAFDDLRAASRETGVAMSDMAQGLETLLQGQFSFDGAKQQIIDLTNVAAVLGQGSLPMLAQAAAKFRAAAFVSFEDVNAVAAQGIPLFEALAQRMGVTVAQARDMARQGLVTGFQARQALNDAANNEAAKRAGQAQEQTLSGVVQRLREGINQSLSQIGSSVARLIDLPTLLTRLRGFVEGVRSVLEALVGPLQGALGANGQNLKQAFIDAQKWTIEAFRSVVGGLFDFLQGMERVANGFAAIVKQMGRYFGFQEKFSPGEEKAIMDRERVLRNNGQAPWFGDFAGEARRLAILQLRNEGKLAPDPLGGIDLKLGDARAKADKALADAANRINNPFLNNLKGIAAQAIRVGENLRQARDQFQGFGDAIREGFKGPLDDAQKQALKFDLVGRDLLQAQGDALKDPIRLLGGGIQGAVMDGLAMLQNRQANGALIGRNLIPILEQQAAMLNQARESVALAPNSADLVASVMRAQARDTSTNVQERIANFQAAQLQEQKRQNEIGANIFKELQRLNQKPPVVQNAGRI